MPSAGITASAPSAKGNEFRVGFSPNVDGATPRGLPRIHGCSHLENNRQGNVVGVPQPFSGSEQNVLNRIVKFLSQEYYSRNHLSPEDVGPSSYLETSSFFVASAVVSSMQPGQCTIASPW